MLDGDEGGRHLEGVYVGVEGVAEPEARQPVLVHPVVQLIVEVRVARIQRVRHCSTAQHSTPARRQV